MPSGITLDLWDTVIHDDSDEPKRSRQGLRCKADARIDIVERAVATADAGVLREDVVRASQLAAETFRSTWRDQHVTLGVPERMGLILSALRVELIPEVRTRAITELEELELDPPPDPVPGAVEGVATLASRWPLAIVSDTVFSPARCLREILRLHGLLDHFNALVFSDEAGCSKPDRRVFERAVSELGVDREKTVHVGDREHNDVKGARRAGMKTVLFIGTRDTDLAGTTADAVCRSWDELPDIISAL